MNRRIAVVALISLVKCVATSKELVQTEGPTETLARKHLWCPKGPLTTRGLDFARSDVRRETHPWAQRELGGCGRVVWCGEVDERSKCGSSADLDVATRQLAVESGCAEGSIAQVQSMNLDSQITYRLSACGQEYSCLIPMKPVSETSIMTGRTVDREPISASVTCKSSIRGQSEGPKNKSGDELPPPPP